MESAQHGMDVLFPARMRNERKFEARMQDCKRLPGVVLAHQHISHNYVEFF